MRARSTHRSCSCTTHAILLRYLSRNVRIQQVQYCKRNARSQVWRAARIWRLLRCRRSARPSVTCSLASSKWCLARRTPRRLRCEQAAVWSQNRMNSWASYHGIKITGFTNNGVRQGCPDRGSGTKFGLLGKFIWFFRILFSVMHFGSWGYNSFGIVQMCINYTRTAFYAYNKNTYKTFLELFNNT